MRRRIIILAVLVSAFLNLHSADAQIIFGQKGYFSSSLVYAGWKIKDAEETELNQWVGVVRIFMPLSDNLELRFLSTGAAADLTNSFSEKKLSGMNDAKIQGACSFADDTFLLTFGVSVPTGEKSLTSEESEIIQMISDNSMRFPVRRYGEGFDISTGFAIAKKVKGVILGLGTGYLIKGKYKPYNSTIDEYKPGDELVFSLGIDFKGEKNLLRLNGIYTSFLKEEFGGEEIYQKGRMYEIGALVSHTAEKTKVSLSLEAILRGKDRLMNQTSLSYEESNSHGNEYRGSLDLGHALSNRFHVRGLLESRFVSANQYPKENPLYVGESQYYGGGAGFDIRIKQNVNLNFAGKYLLGKKDGDKKDLTGINAEAGITFEF